jgi:putative FmdB family regulatory protein
MEVVRRLRAGGSAYPRLRRQTVSERRQTGRCTENSERINENDSCIPPLVVPCDARRNMPLYAYACNDCEAEFELLVRASDTPECPACGSPKLTRQVSRICKEIKYPTIAKSWRRAAAASGDLSNFSKAERGKI